MTEFACLMGFRRLRCVPYARTI